MKKIKISTKSKSAEIFQVNLSYEMFGCPLGHAPIVLVNHALTGNSTVAGKKGWWKSLIGDRKVIDNQKFTILAFNIPGNGYDGVLVDNYKDFTVKCISNLFLQGLKNLNINKIHTMIGGSLGGAIAWQMAYDAPDLFENLIPVVTDFQTSDWVRAQSYLQDRILNFSKNPIQDARVNAMLVYRTPFSINHRFQNQFDTEKNEFKVNDWLDYHGRALENRFQLKAYRLMNHLISTIDVAPNAADLDKIKSNIHIVSVNTDLFFTAERNRKTYKILKGLKNNVYYHEIQSIHGHDAFLMEYEQLNQMLKPIFE
ncbi:Homoserine O-acetyltransferase [Candidatus Ornithobacterium hominis]|uniref:alpha/beta fold hydrolase n=1 Tax=Candidatus Ornithobacterium hominis TaxID=2497989 RepID=UPI000E5B3693|nr:alpha/beta fold hydrolase [Candidatus Ornithobacterium hominis]SZD73207.1 Homoserine O-acetyltransferase [Candidatus Ornithobacterium hominis]